MKILVNYNFKPDDIKNDDYESLYVSKRRDSVFAYSFESEDGSVVALRDHLGSVPLFYRVENGKISCSIFLSELVKERDKIDVKNIVSYLAFGTTKIVSPIKKINSVPPGCVIKIRLDGNIEKLYQYKFKEVKESFKTKNEKIKELDRLMTQAISRVVISDTVGLYLSGGIDSALVGIYLKKAGVKVRAYTSLPWGNSSSESDFSKINAKIINVDEHFLIPLDTARYSKLIEDSLEIYGNPHGITSQLGIISLWQETDIHKEDQIFFGQNVDTMTCSMPTQYQVYFASFLPKFFRRILHSWIGVGNFINDYLYASSKTRLFSSPYESINFMDYKSKITSLTVAGMLVSHTPGDGEALSLPVLKNGAKFSNPYYDVDLIEFCMNQSLVSRVGISRKAKSILCFEKKIFRGLALKYLPKKIVFRKKGFTIPVNKDLDSKIFFESLDEEILGLNLHNYEEKIAAKILSKFMDKYSLN